MGDCSSVDRTESVVVISAGCKTAASGQVVLGRSVCVRVWYRWVIWILLHLSAFSPSVNCIRSNVCCLLFRVTRPLTWPTKCTARCWSTYSTMSNRRGSAPIPAVRGSSTDIGYVRLWELRAPQTKFWAHFSAVVFVLRLFFTSCTASLCLEALAPSLIWTQSHGYSKQSCWPVSSA